MTDQKLINQLKNLRNIHPDQNWVALTRSRLDESVEIRQESAGISGLFNFMIPKPMAISLLAAIVVVVGGGITIFQERFDAGNFVASVRYKSLLVETKKELKEIAGDIRADAPVSATEHTVIFKENSDEQEVFKKALRDKIEAKIGKINDSFAQLEDGDSAREISLNPRRYEENFKLANEEIAVQVRSLLEDAQIAFSEGNLIDALDLVVAIDKLLK